jgi:hypothetical protein
MLPIRLALGFQEDLRNLENRDIQRLAQDLVTQIADNSDEMRRRPLGWVKHVGDLRGCWAIKFDLLGYQNRFRLIFEYLPDDENPTEVVFWAVGPRFGYNVYRAAAFRRSQ